MEIYEFLVEELGDLDWYEEVLIYFKVYIKWKDSLDVLVFKEELNVIKV